MSFQNYGESFQGQQGGEETGVPGAAPAQPQQPPPMGQPMESPAGQFPPGNGGAPGTSPTQQPGQGDAKTTLWFVKTDHNTTEVTAKED